MTPAFSQPGLAKEIINPVKTTTIIMSLPPLKVPRNRMHINKCIMNMERTVTNELFDNKNRANTNIMAFMILKLRFENKIRIRKLGSGKLDCNSDFKFSKLQTALNFFCEPKNKNSKLLINKTIPINPAVKASVD